VRRLAAVAAALAMVAAACSGSGGTKRASADRTTTSPPATATTTSVPIAAGALPGMPPLLDPHDVYAADRPGQLSPEVKDFRNLVYVPNSESNSVDVIDPATFKVVERFPVGRQPQHVVPSYDLKTLYATNDLGNTLTPIDPTASTPSSSPNACSASTSVTPTPCACCTRSPFRARASTTWTSRPTAGI